MSLMHWLGTQCRGRRRLDDPWLRLGAVLVPCLACAVQWTFWSVLQPFVWFLFYPAVFLSARIAGLWGGVASTVVSVLLAWYVFMPPMLSCRVNTAPFSRKGAESITSWILSCILCVLH